MTSNAQTPTPARHEALQIGPVNPALLARQFKWLSALVLVLAVLIAAVLIRHLQQQDLAQARAETASQIERARFDFNLVLRRSLPLMAGLQQDPMVMAALARNPSQPGGLFIEYLKGLLYRNPVLTHVLWLDAQGASQTVLQRQGQEVQALPAITTATPGTALHPFAPSQLQQLKAREFAADLQNNSRGLARLWLATPWMNPPTNAGGQTAKHGLVGYLILSVEIPRLDAPPFRPVQSDGPALHWHDLHGAALGMTAMQTELPRADPALWAAMQNGTTLANQVWQRISLANQDFNGLRLVQAPDLFIVGEVNRARLERLAQNHFQIVSLLCFLGALGTLLALALAYRLLKQSVRLRRHEARMRRAARMGYWRMDVLSGNFKASADVWRAQGSLDPAQFNLQDWLDGFVEPAQRRQFESEMARLCSSEGSFELEVLYQSRQGEHIWILINAKSYLRTGERPVIEGSIQNINARKNAELARQALHEFMQSVFDLSHLAVFEIDVVKNERRCNKHLFHLLGLPRASEQEFEVLDFDARVHPDDLPVLLEMRRGYVDGQLDIYRLPFRVQHTDGHWVWLYGEAKVVARDAQGKATLIRGIHMDVSEIVKAREAAEQASRAKSEFLSRMSHELRTPLNSILGYAQALAYFGGLSEQQAEHVQSIMGGGRHLLNLVNDLLELTRVQNGVDGSLLIKPLSLGPVVSRCFDMVRPQAAERGMQLRQDLQEGHWVQADETRIKQVLLNVLSNAIKYGNPETEVWVSSRRLGSGQLRLSVRDRGPGIASDVGNKVFEPFYRGPLHQFGFEGAGIGLSVSRQLVEAMHGRISFESTPDVGTVFHIDLPAAAPDAVSTEALALS